MVHQVACKTWKILKTSLNFYLLLLLFFSVLMITDYIAFFLLVFWVSIMIRRIKFFSSMYGSVLDGQNGACMYVSIEDLYVYRCSLFNYFYTKTRCQETLFSFILKTLSSSLFASMFCQPILLMSASSLLLFRQPAWWMIRITFHIKKSGKYTEKYFPLAFSALHLSYYHCSFWVFYAGSGFKNIEA